MRFMLTRTEVIYREGKILTKTGRETFEPKEYANEEEARKGMLGAPSIYDSGSSPRYLGQNVRREIRSIVPL